MCIKEKGKRGRERASEREKKREREREKEREGEMRRRRRRRRVEIIKQMTKNTVVHERTETHIQSISLDTNPLPQK